MDTAPAYASVDTEYSKPNSVKRQRKHIGIDREIDKEQRKINNNNNDSPTARNNKQQHTNQHHNNRYPKDNNTATIARRRSPSVADVPPEYRQHHQGVTAVKMADDAMSLTEQERVRLEQEKAERRAAKRNCCMKMLKFLFSNIGLSAMVVLYTVAGGFIFEHLEKVTWSVLFFFILFPLLWGLMYDDKRLHVARSYTSSAHRSFSVMSSFTLSSHFLFGLPLFLLLRTFISIVLLPT